MKTHKHKTKIEMVLLLLLSLNPYKRQIEVFCVHMCSFRSLFCDLLHRVLTPYNWSSFSLSISLVHFYSTSNVNSLVTRMMKPKFQILLGLSLKCQAKQAKLFNKKTESSQFAGLTSPCIPMQIEAQTADPKASNCSEGSLKDYQPVMHYFITPSFSWNY